MNMNKLLNVVIVIVIIVVIYLVYKYIVRLSNKAYVNTNEDKVFFTSPSDATILKKIAYEDIPRAINDTSYSIGVWFYIDDWNYKYQQVKYILSKGSILNHQPSIYLDRTKNILKIKLDIEDGLDEVIEIKDIYMKQWVHLYLNVENTSVNVFLNGKLVKSHILQSNIYNNKDDIIVNQGGGFKGLITKILVSNDIKNQEDIVGIYKNGPYSSTLLDIVKKLAHKIFNKISKLLDIYNV